MTHTLLSQEEATRKFATGLNRKQLMVSGGGACTSISLFAFCEVVVVLPPKLNELEPPNNDMVV